MAIGMIWLLVAIVGGALEKVGNRYFLRNLNDHKGYQFGFNIGAVLLLLILLKNFHFPNLTECVALVISGVFWFLGNSFSFKADQVASVSASTLVAQTQLIFTFVGGIIFFSESFTFVKFIGLFFILSGIIVRCYKSQIHWHGVSYKILSSLAKAAAILIDKFLAPTVSSSLVAASAYVLPLVFLILLPIRNNNSSKLPGGFQFRSLNYGGIIIGAISAGCYVAIINALATLPVSTVMPMYQSNIVLTILLGFVILGEKDSWRKDFFSAIFVIIGAIIMGTF